MCDTRDNIYYLPLSLNKKINVLLYRFPEDYVKFIRNESQHEYELGAHNSKIENDFNPDNSDWIPRVAAWTIDAMAQLKVFNTIKNKELFLLMKE